MTIRSRGARLRLVLVWAGISVFATLASARERDDPWASRGEGQILLLAVGDLTLGHHLEEYLSEWPALALADPLGYPFLRVAPVLRAADLVVANLEGPLTLRGRKLPKRFNFRGHPRMVGALRHGGISAVSLANNHVMDYGRVGLRNTMTILDEVRIAYFGAGESLRDARKGVLIERNGVRVALLGYLCLGLQSGEPPAIYATERRAGAAGHRDPAVVAAMLDEDLPRIGAGADIVIVSMHWGTERSHVPEPYQVALAHRAIDRGAHLVLGHHPHVLQGIEAYERGVIAYSLGNFVFGGNWNPRDKDSIILRVRLSREGIKEVDILPVRIGEPPDAPFQPYLLDGAEAERVLGRLRTYSRGFATIPALR